MLIFTETYTVPPFHYVVFCLHIYNTLVTVTTNTPRLYEVVVKYCHIFSNTTGKHCIFAINQPRGKWHSIDDCTNAIFLSCLESLVSLVVGFYVFCIHLRCNNRILHCIACPSQYMCSVSTNNLYIGKCY